MWPHAIDANEMSAGQALKGMIFACTTNSMKEFLRHTPVKSGMINRGVRIG
jgi:hypothetical protein